MSPLNELPLPCPIISEWDMDKLYPSIFLKTHRNAISKYSFPRNEELNGKWDHFGGKVIENKTKSTLD
jgi:hypothetical protein